MDTSTLLMTAAVAALLALIVLYLSTSRQKDIVTPPPPAQRKRSFSLSDVAEHDKPGDLWLIIDSKVYDFSEYHDIHPGGEAIFRNAGKDSSVGFHGDQHPSKVLDMLDDFYIGDLQT